MPVAGAVKGAIERVMPMDESIDEEGGSRNLRRSFLKNGTGHRFLGIAIFVEHCLEARSISHGV
jgi:hypothetical protein